MAKTLPRENIKLNLAFRSSLLTHERALCALKHFISLFYYSFMTLAHYEIYYFTESEKKILQLDHHVRRTVMNAMMSVCASGDSETISVA